MSFVSFSDSFKYFHTADTFAALVHDTIWLCHVVIQEKDCVDVWSKIKII